MSDPSTSPSTRAQDQDMGWEWQAELLAEQLESMRSKGGLHPYQAGILYILRNHNTRLSRQRRAALTAGDVGNISHWEIVCLLAHAFDKAAREVARDLVDTYHTLEDGQPAP